MRVIHELLVHPGRAGCLFEAGKVWAQRKCEKGQVIHLKVVSNRTEKKRTDKGMAALHCRHLEDEDESRI